MGNWTHSASPLRLKKGSFQRKGAFLHSLIEDIDTHHHSGYPFYDIVKYLLEFQNEVISEKTKKGLSEAKQKGITTGRPRKPDENVKACDYYVSK
ncbi:recombinase family protein [Peribacillus simplex]|uniref:recombinase family protein n=1 Tax=Peribacillus simplex TaxID=1478 RepID=UPI003D2B6CE6